MKIAVVTDIHGNLPALEAVVADAGAVDGWLNLGDILSGPLWPRETATWLMARGWPTIAGNHERQLLTLASDRMGASDRHAAASIGDAARDWLRTLPTRLALNDGLVCVHGAPGDDLQYLLETVTPAGMQPASDAEVAARLGGEDAALLLCGHSHVPRDRRVGATRIVNPGSVGLQAYDDVHPWPHVAETGSPAARYAIVAHDGSAWSVALRSVAYDHESAARRADANGRPDWADALRTGRVGRREGEI